MRIVKCDSCGDPISLADDDPRKEALCDDCGDMVCGLLDMFEESELERKKRKNHDSGDQIRNAVLDV